MSILPTVFVHVSLLTEFIRGKLPHSDNKVIRSSDQAFPCSFLVLNFSTQKMSEMRDFAPLFANQTCVTLEQLTDFFNKNSTISGRFGGLNYI